MGHSLNTVRFGTAAITIALLAALFVSLAGGSASAARLDRASALPKGLPGAAACRKQAARKARAAAARADSAKAARRVARRTQARVQRRCLLKLRRGRAKASVLPTQVGGNLVVGIDGGWGGWGDSEIEERAEIGSPVTRHEWDLAEPVEAKDDIVEVAAGTIGTRIHALIGANELGDPTHYREFVVAFVRRYGIGGSFWDEHPELNESRFAITSVELGNEPYFGGMSPAEYVATVLPALEEIQRLNLPVTVVLPAYAYGEDLHWIEGVAAKVPNLGDLFDAIAFHPYWYGHDPSTPGDESPFERIETMRRWMNETGWNTKPMWITEYGQSTASCGEECVGEQAQAEHLAEMLQAIVSRPDWGIKMISVFQLRDRGTGDPDRERQFGLLRQDGSEKPSYDIVQSAMQQYRG